MPALLPGCGYTCARIQVGDRLSAPLAGLVWSTALGDIVAPAHPGRGYDVDYLPMLTNAGSKMQLHKPQLVHPSSFGQPAVRITCRVDI